ncbi:MAG: hypothetical protein ACRC14_07440 [Paracoccaceae bacterium]
MHNRLRLMMGATALLYLGPLMAGLGGFGWDTVPVFVAIFLAWTLVLRPQSWPQTTAEWLGGPALVTILAQSAVQVLLVTVCFGIGRGIGGVLGALPPFPVMLPIAISFLSIPICRMIWNPARAEAMDRFLDTAIADISASAKDTAPDRSDARALAAQLLAPLQGLPDEASPAVVERHLRAIWLHAEAEDIAHVLLSSARAGTASHAGLCALAIHATDPHVTVQMLGREYPAQGFQLIAGQSDLALLFATRLAATLQADSDIWGDCPDPDSLEAAASGAAPDTAAALFALTELTQSLSPDTAVKAHG